LHWLSYML